jgi:hypothetical protein
MFSLAQVAALTIVGVVVSYLVVVVDARWRKIVLGFGDTPLEAVTAGLSTLLWREAGNLVA